MNIGGRGGGRGKGGGGEVDGCEEDVLMVIASKLFIWVLRSATAHCRQENVS